MNKKTLIDEVRQTTGYQKKDCIAIVDATLDAIEKGVIADKKVTLTGFGSFSLREYAARETFNPIKKARVTYPAKYMLKFKPSADLKEKVDAVPVE